MALATTTDYETITGQTLDGDATTRVSSLLDIASSVVVAEADGQNIAPDTYTETIRPWEGVGYFTQRPVTAVTSVVWNIPGASSITLTTSDYRWTRGGNGRPAKLIRVVQGIDSLWAGADLVTVAGTIQPSGSLASTLDVEYEAGEVPGAITALVVSMVRDVVANGGGPAPTSEALGAASFSYDAANLPPGAFELTDAQKAMVRSLVGVRGATSVPVKAG